MLAKYKGFTLIEMLIVMVIFIALLGLTISSFLGLRTTIQLNQSVQTMQQNFRYAQRSALLLKRDPGENWLYGIGIDLSDIQSERAYRLFKWCTPYRRYGAEATSSRFPAWIDDGSDFTTNGILPTTAGNELWYGHLTQPDVEDCSDSSVTSVNTNREAMVVPMKVQGSGFVTGDSDDPSRVAVNNFEDPLQIGLQPAHATYGRPTYILFESVTGNMYFYNQDGELMNYDHPTYSRVPDPVDFSFVVWAEDQGVATRISVSHLSGKMVYESIDIAEAEANYEFIPTP